LLDESKNPALAAGFFAFGYVVLGAKIYLGPFEVGPLSLLRF